MQDMGMKSIGNMNLIGNTYFSFINLDHRKDRLKHVTAQLQRVGITAERTRGMYPHEYTGPEWKVDVMRKRSPGAIGCHYSMVRIMEKALTLNKHAGIYEDDVFFSEDYLERMQHVSDYCDSHEWDIIFEGGTFHNPPYWHRPNNPELPGTVTRKDVVPTDDPRIVRTYGAFSTFAWIVNVKSIPKLLELLDRHVHESMGIDWLTIKIQPELNCFAYVPGMVKQIDNKSDIGNGWTIFSGFSKVGPWWYADRKEMFDAENHKWL